MSIAKWAFLLLVAAMAPSAAAALPGFQYDGWFGMLSPAGTPRKTVNRVCGEVGRILGLPDIKERIASQGGAATPSTPEDFDKLVLDEIRTRTRIFKAAGTKAE
jgi:tripartite-type tricarboxylate transporter receptor subunit TctC